MTTLSIRFTQRHGGRIGKTTLYGSKVTRQPQASITSLDDLDALGA